PSVLSVSAWRWNSQLGSAFADPLCTQQRIANGSRYGGRSASLFAMFRDRRSANQTPNEVDPSPVRRTHRVNVSQSAARAAQNGSAYMEHKHERERQQASQLTHGKTSSGDAPSVARPARAGTSRKATGTG